MATQDLITSIDQAIHKFESEIKIPSQKTRNMIRDYGHITALSNLITSSKLQKGFKVLRDTGQLDCSFEAVVVRFSSEFEHKVVEAAKWRLKNAKVLP